MKRNKKMNGFISIIMILALVFTNFTISNVRLSADEINTIEISTAEELAKIGNDENYPLDGNYKLTADIENVTTTIGQGTDTYPSVFTGNIDGDGHTVTLNIQAAKTYQGLIHTKSCQYNHRKLWQSGEHFHNRKQYVKFSRNCRLCGKYNDYKLL